MTERQFRHRSSTIYNLYQQAFGISVVRASERLRATEADAETAALLSVARGRRSCASAAWRCRTTTFRSSFGSRSSTPRATNTSPTSASLRSVSFASFFAQLVNGLAGASALFLVAAGLTLIFGVTRVVNFAHGSLYMLGAYIAYTLVAALPRDPLGFWTAVLAAALVVALIGAPIEACVLKHIYAAPELLQLAATFGIVLIVRDAALYIWGAEDLLGPRAPGLSGAVLIFGRAVPTYDLFLIVVGPLVLVVLWWLIERTRFGIARARGDREPRRSPPRWASTSARSSRGVRAGLAARRTRRRAAAAARARQPRHGPRVIAEAFVVTVVGGLGSVPGAFVAALLIGLTKALCIALGNVDFGGFSIAFPKLTLVAEFVVMAIVLVVKPYGLMGTPPAAPPTTPLADSATLVVPPGRVRCHRRARRDSLAALCRSVDRRRVCARCSRPTSWSSRCSRQACNS